MEKIGDIQGWEVVVTTVAAAVTPYMAYKFRERRAKRPKSPHEALYEYYEKFIKLLQDELAKKDTLIEALEAQYSEARKTIREQQEKLDESFELIRQLKQEIANTHRIGTAMQENLQTIKDNTPEISKD